MATDTSELEFLVSLRDEATSALHSLEGVLKDVTGPLPEITAGIDIDASGAAAAAAQAGDAADQVPEDFTTAGEEAGKGLGDGASKGFSAGKAALVAGAAALGVAAGAALASSLGSAMEAEDLNAHLTAQLGLTPALSAQYGKDAGQLYADNYGSSLEEVNGAIASVVTSIGGMNTASSADLQSVTANALSFASAMDVDVSDAAVSAGTLVRTGLAADAAEAFDLMTVAAQQAGPAMTEPIMEAVNEYAKHFATIGFDGSQAMGALVNASKDGEIAVDKVGDAVKEFGIRATDGSTSSVAAYQAIGLNAGQMANDILAGGDTAARATDTIVKGLLGISDPATQAQTAIALFGTPLEDIGVDKVPQFLAAMSSAKGGLGDVDGAAQRVNDTLSGTTSASLETIKRQFQQAFGQELGQVALPILSQAVDLFSDFSGPLLAMGGVIGAVAIAVGIVAGLTAAWTAAQTIASAATGVWTAAQWLLNAALAAPLLPIILVVAAIAALVAGLVWFFTQTEAGQAIVTAVWEGIKAAISATVGWITGTAVPAVVAAWQWVVSTAQGIGAGVGAAFDAIAGWITGAIATVVGVVTGAWQSVADVTSSVWGAISGFFTEWWPLLYAIFLPALFLLQAAWTRWGDDILAAGKTAWAFIRDSIIEPVKEFVTAVLGKLVELGQGLARKWEEFAAAAKVGWEGVKKVIIDPVVEFVTAVGDKLGEFGGWLTSKWTELVGLVRTAWALVKAAVVDPVAEFVADVATKLADFAETVLGPIREAKTKAGDTAKEFLSVGSNIISGIIDGVQNKARDLANTVADAARSALNAAKSALGIHSPSRVFRDEVGAMLGEGWALGVRESGADVVAAAEAIAAEAAAASQVAAGGVAAGGGGVRLEPAEGASRAAAARSVSVTMPSGYTGPSSITVVDADGALIGTMRVVSDEQVAAARQDDLVSTRQNGRGR